MKCSNPELLAPAGTADAAWAALAHGANAIYIGLPRFSARAEAGSTDPETLDEIIGYAHSRNQRVFIALNTLVQQHELGDVRDSLRLIRDLNADAVIVQDMGVAHLIRAQFPDLRMHASTQMAVHNLAGVRQLAEAGFSRVVLARELGVPEIARITGQGGIETEVFIHGALCYSYSGLCLLSSHLLGRSGNRGRCAYCCRQPFRDENGTEMLPFSMKDFSATGHLGELIDAGVISFKIEGRMRSPVYVAAVTDYYRRLFDGKITEREQEQWLSDIQTIFGRSLTDLYLGGSENTPVENRNDGHRGAWIGTVQNVEGPWIILQSNRGLQKYDGLRLEPENGGEAFGFAIHDLRLVTDRRDKRRFELPAGTTMAIGLPPDAPRCMPGAVVYCTFSQAVRQRYTYPVPRPGQYRQRRPIDIRISGNPARLVLSARADHRGTPVDAEVVLAGPFEAARQPERTLTVFRDCLDKLGDTGWCLDKLAAEDAVPSLFVPVSRMNEGRRQLVAEMDTAWVKAERALDARSELTPWPPPGSRPCGSRHRSAETRPREWSVKIRQPIDPDALAEVDEVILEVDMHHLEYIHELGRVLAPGSLRLALPPVIREAEMATCQALISSLPDRQKWEVANVGGLNLLRGRGDITADWSLYTLNTQAAVSWRQMGIQGFVLSPEDDAENLFDLVKYLSDDAIVIVYQHTPLMISANRPGTASLELTDRSRRNFHVDRAGDQFVLTQKTPFSLIDKQADLQAAGVVRFRIDLCYGMDGPEDAADTIRRILRNTECRGHTANYSRGLE